MELMQQSVLINRHPILVGNEQHIASELRSGESLGEFLARVVPEDMGDGWEVIINGQLVPHEVLANKSIRPKKNTSILVRSIVKKQALYIVAMIALTYFTFGIGSAAAGAAGGAAAGAAAGGYVLSTYGVLAATAVYVAGSVIINKLLAPKPDDMRTPDRNTVFNLSASRNQARINEPFPLLFGRVKFAPDMHAAPYSTYEGNTQRVGMILTPGINVGRFDPLTFGDTLLSSYDSVKVYQSGFSGMADTGIPLYTNADTIQGGALNKDRTWVVRQLPADTIRAMFNIEYVLGDADSKGKPYPNNEVVQIEYRQAGGNWSSLITRNFRSSDFDTKRATLIADLPAGTYETRTRILGEAMDGGGSNGRAQFSLNNIIAVQKDEREYRGIQRIGIDMKATGQLQNAPDELRAVFYAEPIPVWKGDAIGFVTEETSNPGAHLLKYARGFYDKNGDLVAGLGFTDDLIDIEGLKAFTLHCAANGYFYDFVVRDARNHQEVVDAIALAGFGQSDLKDGKFSVVWAAADQPTDGVANMATMDRSSFSVDYTLANEADGIEFTYYDRETWELKTLRVPFPGVESILQPSRITGEGVGTEDHAAQLARFHAAQTLYQRKDISYSTNLEHMAYRRMSLLSMSHDLTQWGYSGQLVGAAGNVLNLSQTVPPNANGKSYIGVRVPGERNYRVLECVSTRQNLLRNSANGMGAAWTTENVTKTAQPAVEVDGIQFSPVLVNNTSSGTTAARMNQLYVSPISAGDRFTVTLYFKFGSSGRVRLLIRNSATNRQLVITGTPSTISANFSGALGSCSLVDYADLGDGQRKLVVSFVSADAYANMQFAVGADQAGAAANIVFYGMQVEKGDPTSFITTGDVAGPSQYGPSKSVRLVDAWPADVPLPGTGAFNVRDYVWAYDFKQTPGHRVRVASIEPLDDLQGARVSVVSESPEYWDYIKTGVYIPPTPDSLLQTKPVASRLVIGEKQVVQGDTVFTELVATFDISGPYGRAVVLMNDENGELQPVAETITRTASWRIPAAGVYNIVVRPFAPDGTPGVAANATYATIGADVPPVLVDIFDVVERSGGVRAYTWGWLAGTTQSPDFAGVEIRYVSGSVPTPVWDDMTPVGNEDGFHTAPFEAVIPEAGQWTFAARSRNTSGRLSTNQIVVMKTLGANLGEQMQTIGDNIAQETATRISENARIAQEAAEDAANKANAALAIALSAVDALAADLAEIVNAPEWSATETYQAGWLVRYNGRLYRANQVTTNQRPDLTPAAWLDLGAYSSVAEVASAALQLATTTASELETEANRINALYSRMPTGTGELATALAVEQTNTRIATAEGTISSQASQISGISTTLGQVDTKATNAQTAANNAATAAGNKGKVLFQSTTPATADRLTQNLWIDTTPIGSPAAAGNIPKRWNGTAWVAVQDKAAIDAKAAADAAKTSADATASALTQTNANVTAVDNRVTAQATRVDGVIARLPDGNGKAASEASVSNLQTAMTEGDASNAAAILTVRQNQSGGGNLLSNADFTADSAGWSQYAVVNAVVASDTGRNPGFINGDPGFRYLPKSTSGLLLHATNTVPNGGLVEWANTDFIPVKAADRVFASCRVNVYRCVAEIGIAWYDANGGWLGQSVSGTGVGAGGNANGPTMASLTLLEISNPTKPANTAYMRLVFWLRGNGENNPYVWFAQPFLQIGADGQLKPAAYMPGPNYSVSATATQALTVANGQASLVQQVQANQNGGSNLLPNSDFGFGSLADNGWGQIWNAGNSVASFYVQNDADGGIPKGTIGAIAIGTSNADNALLMLGNFTMAICEGGKDYIASVYASGYPVSVGFLFYDQNQNYITEVGGPTTGVSGGGSRLIDQTRVHYKYTAPANAHYMRIRLLSLQSPGTARGQYFTRFIRPMIERARPGQTEPSDWTPSAIGLSSVTFATRAGLNAKAGLYLDVNGRISGYETTNNGVVSDFTILTDVFRLTSPNGGARLEFSNGNLRVYNAGGVMTGRWGSW